MKRREDGAVREVMKRLLRSDAGVDPKTVQYLAGHENSKTTMDIYARVKYNKPEELFEVVNDALNQENFDEKSPISMVKE